MLQLHTSDETQRDAGCRYLSETIHHRPVMQPVVIRRKEEGFGASSVPGIIKEMGRPHRLDL